MLVGETGTRVTQGGESSRPCRPDCTQVTEPQPLGNPERFTGASWRAGATSTTTSGPAAVGAHSPELLPRSRGPSASPSRPANLTSRVPPPWEEPPRLSAAP